MFDEIFDFRFNLTLRIGNTLLKEVVASEIGSSNLTLTSL